MGRAPPDAPDELVEQLAAELAGEDDIALAVLVGSRARGDFRRGSDLDLLVELVPRSEQRLIAIRDTLQERFGVEVELLTHLSVARSQRSWNQHVSDGRVVVDRDDQWPSVRANPERARRAALKFVDLTARERVVVKWLGEGDQLEDKIERAKRISLRILRAFATLSCDLVRSFARQHRHPDLPSRRAILRERCRRRT
jgi:predicted nucleotidyltransferase